MLCVIIFVLFLINMQLAMIIALNKINIQHTPGIRSDLTHEDLMIASAALWGALFWLALGFDFDNE